MSESKKLGSFEIFLMVATALAVISFVATFIEDQIPSFYINYGWTGSIGIGIVTLLGTIGLIYWSTVGEN